MGCEKIKTVVVINDVANVNGGAAKVAIEEAKGLARFGIEVIFFAPCGPVDKGLVDAGVRVVCLNQIDIAEDEGFVKASIRGVWNFESAHKLSDLLSSLDKKSTFIHMHSFTRGLTASAMPAINGSGIKYILTMHEYFLACPNGGFFDYQEQKICSKKPLGGKCITTNCDARSSLHKAWRIVRHSVMHSFGRLPASVKNIIYISETQLGAVKKHLPQDVEFYYLSNPVNIDSTKGRIDVQHNDIFLYVGRLSPEKGCVDFARLAHQKGVNAVFLGAGPEEGRIREVNPNARMMGWVSSDEVNYWMEKARALVFPSLWYEGQPLISMEAMARGLPVILGSWNAGSENVVNNVTGMIYGSKEDLGASLDRMTPEVAHKMSIAAFERRESYGLSIQEHIEKLIKIYSAVVSK